MKVFTWFVVNVCTCPTESYDTPLAACAVWVAAPPSPAVVTVARCVESADTSRVVGFGCSGMSLTPHLQNPLADEAPDGIALAPKHGRSGSSCS